MSEQNKGEVMKYVVQWNSCDCHPESCGCKPYVLLRGEKRVTTFMEKDEANRIAAELNALASAQDEIAELRKYSLSKEERWAAIRWLDVTRLYAFTEPSDEALAAKLEAQP